MKFALFSWWRATVAGSPTRTNMKPLLMVSSTARFMFMTRPDLSLSRSKFGVLSCEWGQSSPSSPSVFFDWNASNFRSGSVVLPRSTRVAQMIMKVPLMMVALWAHHEASSSNARSNAMPPRSPACHIMHWWLKDIIWEAGSLMNHFMQLLIIAHEEVDMARPIRQSAKPNRPNSRPRNESISAVDRPQSMKTRVSMKCAEMCRYSLVFSTPFSSKCWAPYPLKMPPATRLAMMPE
mmetsp:Transcript_104782/g.291812  ORF Transcript_104782/g.291812 Transcript_104782/m.291812 type:complete len:236 (+) Transcript_104782:232-939(+)